MPVKRKEIAKRRNSQKEKAVPLEMGSGSTPGPLLKRVCRLSDMVTPKVYKPSEMVTESNLRALRNLMMARVMEVERENYPGSWAWRNPK